MLKRLVLACFLGIQLFAPVAQASEAPLPAPTKRIPYKSTGESENGISVLRVVLGLGLVLATGVGVVLLLRRYLPASYGGAVLTGARRIELVELRRLTPKLTLFLIAVDNKQILFAQSGDRVTPMQLTPLTNGEQGGRASIDT